MGGPGAGRDEGGGTKKRVEGASPDLYRPREQCSDAEWHLWNARRGVLIELVTCAFFVRQTDGIPVRAEELLKTKV